MPDTDGSAIDDVLAAFATQLCAVGGRSPATAQTYDGLIRVFAAWLDDHRGRPVGDAARDDVEAWLADLAARGAKHTSRRTALYALRSFYAWFGRDTGRNPAAEVAVAKEPPPVTDVYTDAQADAILAAAADGGRLDAAFDHAVLATLRWTGVRVGELVSLRTDAVDLPARRIRVVGKGSKARLIPLPHPCVEVLDGYLAEVRPACAPSAHVFSSPRSRPASPATGRLTGAAVRGITHKYAALAGVPGRHHPHRWRHTYATGLLRSGIDIHTVQRLLGHVNIATTTRYLHLLDDDLRAAVDQAFG